MNKPEPFWLSQADMARSCRVSLSAFQKWNVRPVAKIGRKVYYSAEDVLNNRRDRSMLGTNSEMAKLNPAVAEYARRRIAELEVQIEASG